MYQQNSEYFSVKNETEYYENQQYSNGCNTNEGTEPKPNLSNENNLNEPQYQQQQHMGQQYQQPNTYSNNYYNGHYYPYTPYYSSTYQYSNNYNFNTDKFSSYSTYDPYSNIYQNNYQSVDAPGKSTTPTPQITLPTTDQITPEKPVMNDSGVEIISPQITNTSTSSNISLNQSPALNVQQKQTQEQSYSTNIAPNQQDLLSAYNHFEINNAQQSKQDDSIPHESEGEENDEDNDEDDETDEKENNKTKNKKMKKQSSASSSSSNDPSKPPKPYLEIIANAILSTEMKMMQLHEIYNLMEKKYDYFAKNINKSWRNSVRHNLSLNECFKKAGRGTNGKGNYWEIHPACLNEFIRGNFRRKTFKQLIRAYNSNHGSHQSSHSAYASAYNTMNYASSFIPPLPHQFQAGASTSRLPTTLHYPFFNNTNLVQLDQSQSTSVSNFYAKSEPGINIKSSSRYHPY